MGVCGCRLVPTAHPHDLSLRFMLADLGSGQLLPRRTGSLPGAAVGLGSAFPLLFPAAFWILPLTAKACLGRVWPEIAAQHHYSVGQDLSGVYLFFMLVCGSLGGPQGPRLGVSVPSAPEALPAGAGAGIPALRSSPSVFLVLWLPLQSQLSARSYSPRGLSGFPLVALRRPCVRGPAAPPRCVRCGLVFLDALGLTEDSDLRTAVDVSPAVCPGVFSSLTLSRPFSLCV